MQSLPIAMEGRYARGFENTIGIRNGRYIKGCIATVLSATGKDYGGGVLQYYRTATTLRFYSNQFGFLFVPKSGCAGLFSEKRR